MFKSVILRSVRYRSSLGRQCNR